MDIGELKIEISERDIIGFCQRWKIAELSFFGSVLREDFAPDSDVDVLVSFKSDARWSLFDWIEMRKELEELLKREVDLVSKEGLRNPFRRSEILQTRKKVYEAA